MDNISKPVATICIAVGGASLSGLLYSYLTSSKSTCENNKSETGNTNENNNTADDTENNENNDTNVTVEKCSCPLNNMMGVSVTGGIVSGVVSWYLIQD